MSALSVPAPFIRRPIATSLLGLAVLMGGMLGYSQLPVSSLPLVDFPTVQVSTRFSRAPTRTRSRHSSPRRLNANSARSRRSR